MRTYKLKCLGIGVLIITAWLAFGFFRACSYYQSELDHLVFRKPSWEVAIYEFQERSLLDYTSISLSVHGTQPDVDVWNEIVRVGETNVIMRKGSADVQQVKDLMDNMKRCRRLRKMQNPRKFFGHGFVLTFDNTGELNSYTFDDSALKVEPELAELMSKVRTIRSETKWERSMISEVHERQMLGLRWGTEIIQFPPRYTFLCLWFRCMYDW